MLRSRAVTGSSESDVLVEARRVIDAVKLRITDR